MKLALTWLLLVATTAFSANASGPAPFPVGEKLTYDILWGPFVAGHATLTVAGRAEIDCEDCYHIVGQAQTTGFVDLLYHVDSTIETWLDATNYFTRRFSQTRHEGKHATADDSRYDYAAGQVVTTNRINGQVHTAALVAPDQDVLSVFYFLRTQALELTRTIQVPIDLTGKHYDVTARPDQRKTLYFRTTGDVPALRIEPHPTFNIVAASGGRMWFWVSDDARKVPLLMVTETSFGNIRFVLTAMEPAAAPKPTLSLP